MEPELMPALTKPVQGGKSTQKHVPNGEQGSWRGAVTQALVLHLPSLYFLSPEAPCMGAGWKVGASDTRKVWVPPAISASHRPGSGLCCSSHCTQRQAGA